MKNIRFLSFLLSFLDKAMHKKRIGQNQSIISAVKMVLLIAIFTAVIICFLPEFNLCKLYQMLLYPRNWRCLSSKFFPVLRLFFFRLCFSQHLRIELFLEITFFFGIEQHPSQRMLLSIQMYSPSPRYRSLNRMPLECGLVAAAAARVLRCPQ